VAEPSVKARRSRNSEQGVSRSRATSVRRGAQQVAGALITTPERPVYPALGFTKLDLARYYERVARLMLPYVADRPLTLVRCELGATRADALRSECKFLRHEPGYHRWVDPRVRRVQIREQKKLGEYLVVDDESALVSLVQGAILEIHCWNARASQVERPDRWVLDLDPDPDLPWSRVVEAALLVRAGLERLELASWVKLTGGKGLHVIVPFVPEHDWDDAYRACARTAEALARVYPQLFTTNFARAARRGRVLLDYKRNHRAAVAVAAYSSRASPRGTVSLPVRWRELGAHGSDGFDVRRTLARIARARGDPLRDLYGSKQRLSARLLR
jgi:bifunctional non-homologous end joining protein LigD